MNKLITFTCLDGVKVGIDVESVHSIYGNMECCLIEVEGSNGFPLTYEAREGFNDLATRIQRALD